LERSGIAREKKEKEDWRQKQKKMKNHHPHHHPHDPNSSSIDLFSNQRHREHHKRDSIMIDDVDLILHERATRRSLIYGGNSQGPAFWNRLKSAVNRTPTSTPTSANNGGGGGGKPTIQTLNSQQELQIFSSAPKLTSGDSDDLAVSNTVTTTSLSSSSLSTSSRSRCLFNSPFQSIWDRLDTLSYQERQRKHDYHNTVKQQNELISPTTNEASINSAPTVASYRQQPSSTTITATSRKPGKETSTSTSTSTVTSPMTTVGMVAGRLRRQHSWNGRDSARDILQARGSVLATVEDGLFQDITTFDEKDNTDNGTGRRQQQLQEEELEIPKKQSSFDTNNNTHVVDPSAAVEKNFFANTTRNNQARKKAEDSVLNLVM
jgi:hypothetical protein